MDTQWTFRPVEAASTATERCPECDWAPTGQSSPSVAKWSLHFHRLQTHFHPELTFENLTTGPRGEESSWLTAERIRELHKAGTVYVDGEQVTECAGKPVVEECANGSLRVTVLSSKSGKVATRTLSGDIIVHH